MGRAGTGSHWAPDYTDLLAGVAGIAAAAAGTAFPAGHIVAAVLGATHVKKADDWRKRLVDAICDWVRAEFDSAPSDLETLLLRVFKGRKTSNLDPEDPRYRAELVEAFATSVFVPLIERPNLREDSRVKAERLVAALPELLLKSAPEGTPLWPLRELIGRDLVEMRERLVGLSGEIGYLRTEFATGLMVRKPDKGSMQDLRSLLEARLPPAPADRLTVGAYLAGVVEALAEDPLASVVGAHLQCASAPLRLVVLPGRRAIPGVKETPAQVETEQARDLVSRCDRLVVLGGPGSGKSSLARRIVVDAAEAALAVLADPVEFDRREIPLFASCPAFLLAAMAPGLTAWTAVVDAALGTPVGDYIGSERTRQALRARFVERPGRYLIVIDGLDEATTTMKTVEVFGALVGSAPARLVLTSRRSAWQGDVPLDDGNERHVVSELQPIDYPADVTEMVNSWLGASADAANALLLRLAERPDLARAACVPLVAALYCLVARDPPFPETRVELYNGVVRRLIEGGWRHTPPEDHVCDRARALARSLAWESAESDLVSGVGDWKDEFIGDLPFETGPDVRRAVDHLAPIIRRGPALRRFVHRTIREFLVAEWLARMPFEEVAQVLGPHLWFDKDWEEVIPTALALHPNRSELLIDLLGQGRWSALASRRFSTTLGSIEPPAKWDPLVELRLLLSRVAGATIESDWSEECAQLINAARQSLLHYLHEIPGVQEVLVQGRGWMTSDRWAIASALAELSTAEPSQVERLSQLISSLGPSSNQLTAAREVLVSRTNLGTVSNRYMIVRGIAALGANSEDCIRACASVLAPSMTTNSHDLIIASAAAATLFPDVNQRMDALNELLRRPLTESDEGIFANWISAYSLEERAKILKVIIHGESPIERVRRERDMPSLPPVGDDAIRLGAELDHWQATRLRSASGVLEPLSRGAEMEDDLATSERRSAFGSLESALQAGRESSKAWLAWCIASLGPTEDEREKAHTALLNTLESEGARSDPWMSGALAALIPPGQISTPTWTLLERARHADGDDLAWIEWAIQALGTTKSERILIRDALIERLDSADLNLGSWIALWIERLLEPTPKDLLRARTSLLKRRTETRGQDPLFLDAILHLSPDADTLAEAARILRPPYAISSLRSIGQAVRMHTSYDAWLEVLPRLPGSES